MRRQRSKHHLAELRAGSTVPLSAERYAALFEQVSNTLDALSRRGLVHRDVKPGNLFLTRGLTDLLVGDFSIATRSRRVAGASAQPTGTSRYIAREQFVGGSSAHSDQYALGATATETFALVHHEPAVDAVLATATAQRPSERYESIAAFGSELRMAATSDGRPRGSRRLEQVKPEWRNAWRHGLFATAAAYVALFTVPRPELGLIAVIVAPTAGLLITVVARIAADFSEGRTRPRVAFANHLLLPPALSAAWFALMTTNHPPFDRAVKESMLIVSLTYVLAAWMGSAPTDAGRRIITIVRSYERRRRTRGPLGARGRAVALAIVLAVLAAPLAVDARRAPQHPTWPTAKPAGGYGYVRVLAAFRAASLRGDTTEACALVHDRAGFASCPDWLPRTRDWLRAGAREAGGRPYLGLAPLDSFTIQDQPGTAGYYAQWIEAKTAAAPVALVTILKSDVVSITVGKNSPRRWDYDIARFDDRWQVTDVDYCARSCVHLTSLKPTP